MLPIKVIHTDLGVSDFKQTWDLQKRILEKKKIAKMPDVLLSTEHDHVYTLGRSGEKEHLLLDDEAMKIRGVSYYEIDRGGDLTYHGPGQIVVYPIFDLHNYYLDTHRYLRDLEEAVILTLREFGIESHRDEEFTGVWVGEEKICAIGIKVSKWITMHGLAFNVNTDLSYFDSIIPCGIFHKGVTSMSKILNAKMNLENVKKVLVLNILKVFGADANPSITKVELESIIGN